MVVYLLLNMHEQVTIKLWAETRKILRLIHAMTGESMVKILHRLVEAELLRINGGKSVQDQINCQ